MPEVSPLARQSNVATPIHPITGRHWLSPAFRYPASRQPSLQSAFLPRGEMLGLPCSVQVVMNELAPASTPAVALSVCLHGVGRQPTACHFGGSLSAPLAPFR